MMFSRRRSATALPPSIPAGKRVYAIGDVHGRLDLLRSLLDMIDADDARRGAADTMLILLGDIIDRGPDSAEVVAYVRELARSRGAVRLIKGNHEALFVEAARGDSRAARHMMAVGGGATLASYGIDPAEAEAGSYEDLAQLLLARISRGDIDFLDGAEDLVRIGDYLFVHAGIRPGRPLDEQSAEDLRWIRREFVESGRDHGVIVIHGHSISTTVDERSNRIGIDTGAYASGILTAIGLEGADRWYLSTQAARASSVAAA